MRFKRSILFAAILASSTAMAQSSDPINLDSIPIENLVIRVPAGMNITYSPKIALASGNTLPAAAVGTAYSFDFKTKATITHDEAPDLSLATWSLLTPAPSGLNISPSGVLSGTPINEGSYSFEVAAIYKGSKDTQVYVMEVTLDVAVALAGATPPKGVVGQVYAGFDPRSLVQVSGDPSFNIDAVTWSVKSGSALPAGLTLNTSTGLIAGTPTAAFTGPVTLVAMYKGESGEQAYEFTVDLNIVVTLAEKELPAATMGQEYEGFDFKTALSVVGDDTFSADQAVFSLASSSTLPEGLSLSEEGVLTGAPSSQNLEGHDFQVDASYKEKVGSQSYKIVINGVELDVLHLTSGYRSSASSSSCVVTTKAELYCWGAPYGEKPVKLDGTYPNVVKFTGSHTAKCMLFSNGEVSCLGGYSYSAVLNGTSIDAATGHVTGGIAAAGIPGKVTGISDAIDIAAGEDFACVVTTSGAVKCWGDSNHARFLTGGMSEPVVDRIFTVSGFESGKKQVAIGVDSICALSQTGTVQCFGRNKYGQLGNGKTMDVGIYWYSGMTWTPQQVIGLVDNVQSISGNSLHYCAIMNTGTAKCWGKNWNDYALNSPGADSGTHLAVGGAIGNGGSGAVYSSPQDVSGLSGVKDIQVGYSHSCATTLSDDLYCWGYNSLGRLGRSYVWDGQRTFVPIQFNTFAKWKKVIPSKFYTCGISLENKAHCWGDASFGALGGAKYPTYLVQHP